MTRSTTCSPRGAGRQELGSDRKCADLFCAHEQQVFAEVGQTLDVLWVCEVARLDVERTGSFVRLLIANQQRLQSIFEHS